jgi:Flp pilus assembly protein TadG
MTDLRCRDETGTALVEVTWLAILLLVPLVYVVVAVFEVQRSSFAVSAATRAAGRAYTLAPTQGAGLARARAAAGVALHDQGLDVTAAQVDVACAPDPGDCLSPGSVVHVTMSYPVHTVPYGTFREDRS